jgi:hypothetical protein
MLTQAAMALYRWRYWRPVERMAAHPGMAQSGVLRNLIARNRDTAFGQTHGFSSIRSVADFRRQIPIVDYEALRPYIDRQRREGIPALTSEAPLFYAQTSGSTGAPKHIPITPSALETHREEQALFSYLQYRACPEAYAGQALGIMGAAVEDRLDTGHAVGSVSGHLYQSLPRAVRSRFVVPPIVSTIADYELKYLLILQLALASPDVSYLGTPNPSTFLRLITLLNEQRERLLHGLATGRADVLERVPAEVRAAVASRLSADPARAAHLSAIPTLTLAAVWPRIRLLTTWTGGSCGIALAPVRRSLPAAAKVMELGYQATEFRGTIAIDAETPAGLPVLHHHFFEFARPHEWDAGLKQPLELAELEDGEQYYVIVTTANGLYRYFMNDLVEVQGRFRETPLLRFVQKGKGVTSLTGEKLYEAQAIRAVQAAAEQLHVTIPFFLLVADEQKGGYTLYAESGDRLIEDSQVAYHVDRGLAALNVEYAAKRESGRLVPLTARALSSGAALAYKAACVRAGQREGQFKPVVLLYRRDLKWDVEASRAS